MRPQLLVQSLQGTRAQILFAFLFAGHAMDVDELRTWTGKDRKTHYGHLAALCVAGLLAKQRMAHGRNVYLLGSEMLPSLQAWVAQIGAGNSVLESGVGLLQESAFRTPGATTTTANGREKKDKSAVVVDSGQESAFRTPGTVYLTHGVTFEKNLAACRAVGIGEPKASRIAGMAHVTPDLIKAHVESLDASRGEGIGLAILRIEGDEMPRVWLEEIKKIPRPADEIILEEESEDEL